MAVPLAAFAAGAVVAVIVGVFGRVHDPTLSGTTDLGFRTVIEMKVAVSLAIAVLLALQLVSACGSMAGSAAGRLPGSAWRTGSPARSHCC